ncbi:MAG TPA: hypothetical protein VG273_20400 [Bryobacteraceae bacterium]|nr:hypothetical protein [Bryobacteraceae bacterium]
MSVFRDNLPLILACWMAVLAIMVVARQRKHTAGVGLVLTYVISLWLNYWVASLVYVAPWYLGPNLNVTTSGAEQSLYAVAAFAFGSIAIAPFLIQSGILPRATVRHEMDPRLPQAYLLAGAFFFLLGSTFIGKLPTVSAIVSSGQQLIVVGLGLCWWQGWLEHDRKRMFFYLALSMLLPAVTVATRGFLLQGAIATITFLVFISNFSRSKIRMIIAAGLMAYLGISVYVTYMRDRAEIRKSVWGGDSLSDRWDRIQQTLGTFELFDPTNPLHLQRIDDRMNQSALVGSAVIHLEETKDYARGETLYDAVLALIPRALWPDKPISAGSGNLVSRFTGIDFQTGGGQTSVGIGAVLEFYANFGTMGVLCGFLILGILVTSLDVLATERLMNSDLSGFVLIYLTGLAFLQVGGQLVEVTATAAGSIIVALAVNKYLHRYQRKTALQTGIPATGLPGAPPPLHHNP